MYRDYETPNYQKEDTILKSIVLFCVIAFFVGMFTAGFQGRADNLSRFTEVGITSQAQATRQSYDWWVARYPTVNTVPEGVAEEGLKPKGTTYSWWCRVGMQDTHGTTTILGEGHTWDDAFTDAINKGHPATCCEGGVDWERTNAYLKKIGKPTYKKLPTGDKK